MDDESETTSESYTVNRLFIKGVSRSLLKESLQCRARSSDLSPPVTRDVALEIYRKSLMLELFSVWTSSAEQVLERDRYLLPVKSHHNRKTLTSCYFLYLTVFSSVLFIVFRNMA
jgi:hypothetical protein